MEGEGRMVLEQTCGGYVGRRMESVMYDGYAYGYVSGQMPCTERKRDWELCGVLEIVFLLS